MPSDRTTNDAVDASDLNRTDESAHSSGDEPVVVNDIASPENARRNATTAGFIHSDEVDGALGDAEDQWSVDVGIDVVGSCGHKIGEVVDVRDNYVVVEKGFFMPEDVFVPKSAISGADEHHLTLNVTKDYATHSDWDEDPEDRVDQSRRVAS